MNLPFVQVLISGRSEWLAIDPSITAAGLVARFATEAPSGHDLVVLYMDAEVPDDALLSNLVAHKDTLSLALRPQRHSTERDDSPLIENHSARVLRWPMRRIALGGLFSTILCSGLALQAGLNATQAIQQTIWPHTILLPLAIGFNCLQAIVGILSFSTTIVFLAPKVSGFLRVQIVVVGLIEATMFSLLSAFLLYPLQFLFLRPTFLIGGILFALGAIYPLWASLEGCLTKSGGSIHPYSCIQIAASIVALITSTSAIICLLVVVITSQSYMTGIIFLYEGLFLNDGGLYGEELAIGRTSAFFSIVLSLLSPGWYLVSTRDIFPFPIMVVQFVFASISTFCQTGLLIIYPLLYVAPFSIGFPAGGLDTGVLVLSAFSFLGTVSAAIGISRRLFQQYPRVLPTIQ